MAGQSHKVAVMEKWRQLHEGEEGMVGDVGE